MKRSKTLLLLSTLTAMVFWNCSLDKTSDQTQSGSTAQIQIETQAATSTARASGSSTSTPKLGLSAIDTDGQWRDLSEWIGQQPVVINFWGTWCPPCRHEIPDLVKLYGEYKGRGVEIVSLALERRSGPQQVQQFADQAGMDWTMLMGNDNVTQGFRLSGAVPTTIFFDRNGREVNRHIGARNYEVFKKDFEAIASN